MCLITNPIWVVKTRLQLQRPSVLVQNVPSVVSGSSPTPLVKLTNAAAAASQQRSLQAAAASTSTSLPQQLSSSSSSSLSSSYRGFVDCLTQIAKTEGLPGLYKGLLPSLFLVSHGAIQFAVYEELKTAAVHLRDFVRPLSGDVVADSTSDRILSSAEITACGALSKLAASVVTYPSQVVRSRLQQRMDARVLKYKGVVDVLRTTVAREGLGGLYKGLVPNVIRVMPQSALTFLVYETVMQQLKNMDKK